MKNDKFDLFWFFCCYYDEMDELKCWWYVRDDVCLRYFVLVV